MPQPPNPVVPPVTNTPSADNKEDVIKFFGEDDADDTELIQLDKASKEPPAKGEDDEDEEDEPKESAAGSEGEDEDEDEESEKEDELKEIEDELKEPDEEDLELVTPVRRKEILAKYPKLFKEFPYLEKAYYREQKYTEIYPTVDDAKLAARKSQALDGFEKELNSGKIENILSVVSKHNENSFNQMVDDLIPSLLRVDEKAGYHVIGNIIKDTIVSMVNAGRKANNTTLTDAARELNKFIFGTEDYEPPTKLAKDTPEPAEDNVQKREREFTRRQFETTRDTLNDKVDKMLRKTIETNIDPRSSMTDYIRRNATREAMESVTDIINGDTRFKVLLDKLWERAIKTDFKADDVERIKKAYVSKATTLLPSVIKKARQEALKGIGKRVREEKPEVEEKEEPEEESPRQKKTRDTTPSSNRGPSDKDRARKIPAHVTSRDYLMSDD